MEYTRHSCFALTYLPSPITGAFFCPFHYFLQLFYLSLTPHLPISQPSFCPIRRLYTFHPLLIVILCRLLSRSTPARHGLLWSPPCTATSRKHTPGIQWLRIFLSTSGILMPGTFNTPTKISHQPLPRDLTSDTPIPLVKHALVSGLIYLLHPPLY
jgi:hypothetical protein